MCESSSKCEEKNTTILKQYTRREGEVKEEWGEMYMCLERQERKKM